MDANVRRQVIEYLSKKGYNRTEAMLRNESANQDVEGKPIHTRIEDAGGAKYGKALGEGLHAVHRSLVVGCTNCYYRFDASLD